jgi:pimeloyl-ACP methyl ester carboxylesterase
VKNLRTYGKPRFKVVVIHGGPGAAGEMAPVARELASGWGVLEPLQTEASVEGQIQELRSVLEEKADLPASLIGFSWGAWLSFLVAARCPTLVKKLLLVSSGPFEEKYAARVEETRLSRLSEEERTEVESLFETLGDPAAQDKDRAFARFGALFSKADAFDPMKSESEGVRYRPDIFQAVWREAAELRKSGKLIRLAGNIRCPVVAIHGDYDPHPSEGVNKPLSAILADFRLVLLKSCGHRPWIERRARSEFFRVLKQELGYRRLR